MTIKFKKYKDSDFACCPICKKRLMLNYDEGGWICDPLCKEPTFIPRSRPFYFPPYFYP